MADTVKRMRANKVAAERDCGVCGASIQFGSDVTVCVACNTVHHTPCWEEQGGCPTEGCENAALKQLDPAVVQKAEQVAPPGKKHCEKCGKLVREAATRCPHCRAPLLTSRRGARVGQGGQAPGATASLVYGIIGLLICGIILGPLAISKANSAKAAIARDPSLTGAGLANAGFVLGIIDIVGFVAVMLLRVMAAS